MRPWDTLVLGAAVAAAAAIAVHAAVQALVLAERLWRWLVRPPEVHFVITNNPSGCAPTAIFNFELYHAQRHLIERGSVAVHISMAGAASVPPWVQRLYDERFDKLSRQLRLTSDGVQYGHLKRWIRRSFGARAGRCTREQVHRYVRCGQPMLVVEPEHLVLVIKANGQYHRLDGTTLGVSRGDAMVALDGGAVHGFIFRGMQHGRWSNPRPHPGGLAAPCWQHLLACIRSWG